MVVQDGASHSDNLDSSQPAAFWIPIGVEIDFCFPSRMINVYVWRRMILSVDFNAESADPQDGRQARKPKALGYSRKI